MQQSYLSAIQQLILQIQTVKSTNRKLTTTCQNLLDDIVALFKQFFPSIPIYDSDNIFQACQQICKYYHKQLFIVKTQTSKNLLQIVNLYGLDIQDQIMQTGFDNIQQFLQVMKTGKSGILQQLTNSSTYIEQLQHQIQQLQKQLQIKQLQIKRISIDGIEKQSQFQKLKNQRQIFVLEISNLTKQLARIHDQCQNLQIVHATLKGEYNSCRLDNQSLRRRMLNLEKEKMEKVKIYGEGRL